VENARMRPKFLNDYRIWAGVFIGIFLISAMIMLNANSVRTQFVRDYRAISCSIESRDFQAGKGSYFRWNLSCSDHLRRQLDVSEPQYETSKVGQEVTIYASKESPAVWEKFVPTPRWHDELVARYWVIYFVTGLATFGIFRSIWKWARSEVSELVAAVITEAEVMGVVASDDRGSLPRVKLRFPVKGEVFEGMFPTTSKMLGDHFETRTVQVAVNENEPAESRILSMFMVAELIPKE
jgi:hypothetical protein